ncbi:MAG: PfkB family carbohydrate kinase [Candidatus Neomarinimicrobiota bacterium]
MGSIALDTLETDAGRKTDILGGAATFYALAASLFAPVRLVGVVGSDFPEAGWRLFRERGVDVSDVEQVEGRTFRWGGRYSADLNSRETLFTELGVFEHFKPRISRANQQTPLVYLGNIQPSLQLAVHKEMAGAEIFIADTMNMWIDLFPAELEQVLAKTDIFLLNDEEAVQYTGESDLDSAARALLAAGPDTVIIKQGRAGALLVSEQIRRHIPAFPDAKAVDPTGAGDSFAGGFVAQLAVNGLEQLEQAVVMAAATASFTVEGFGLEGILPATANDVLHRADVITGLMD